MRPRTIVPDRHQTDNNAQITGVAHGQANLPACAGRRGGLLAIRPALAQADTVTVKRAAQLRESPAESAPILASLPVQTPLTRLANRRGPWIEVRTGQGQTGWVHLFDVGTVPVAQGGNFATGALARADRPVWRRQLAPQTRSATSTIGIRGLGAEEITNAQPNLTAVSLMETLRMDASQAQQFAAAAQGRKHRAAAGAADDQLVSTPGAAGDRQHGANR